MSQHPQSRLGLLYGASAYLAWGLSPLYYKLLRFAPIEVLAHRVAWSVLLLGLVLALQRRWPEIRQTLRTPRTLALLIATTLLVSVNWYLYLWAIDRNFILQASLGYFMTPLVQVGLGLLFLRERLRPWQIVSVLLALAGVAYLARQSGQMPWIAIGLALSFSLYALLRKVAHVAPLPGLSVETGLLLLPALGLIFIGLSRDRSASAFPWDQYLLVPFAGVLTAVPLLWFASAAQRLPLTTLGFLQYITPTCQFLLAVLLYREPFSRDKRISFCLIWIALALYGLDSLRAYRDPRRRQPHSQPQSPVIGPCPCNASIPQ